MDYAQIALAILVLVGGVAMMVLMAKLVVVVAAVPILPILAIAGVLYFLIKANSGPEQ